MKLLGFNFTKMSVEKISSQADKINIAIDVKILEVKKISNELLKSEGNVVSFRFSYNINYEPNVAKVNLEGEIVLLLDEDSTKKIIDQWNSNSSLLEDFRETLFNLILKKSNLRAMSLEEELNLPIHLHLGLSPSKK